MKKMPINHKFSGNHSTDMTPAASLFTINLSIYAHIGCQVERYGSKTEAIITFLCRVKLRPRRKYVTPNWKNLYKYSSCRSLEVIRFQLLKYRESIASIGTMFIAWVAVLLTICIECSLGKKTKEGKILETYFCPGKKCSVCTNIFKFETSSTRKTRKNHRWCGY